MKVKTVSFGYTKNLGNFESARADATVECTDGNEVVAMELAVAIVKEQLDMPMEASEKEALHLYRLRPAGAR